MSLLNLPVPKDVRTLIFAMESLHVPKGPYVTPRGPTGEEFITFRPGPVPEGQAKDVLFLTPEAAIRAFWLEFIKYSHDHKGEHIYWRCKPEIDASLFKWNDGGKFQSHDVFQVRSRFYCSHKQVLSRDAEQECLGLKKSA